MLKATPMKRLLWLLILALSPCEVIAQNLFYQGKTITVIAGVSAGSVYDLYTRLMTQHMGKHIPGNPSFVVQNMTGAGSIIGANYLYNVSKPDGLTIGAVQPSIFFNQLQKHQEVKFDWAKFAWIGSSDKSDWLLYLRADLPYKSLADIRRTNASPRCGSTGVGTSESYMPKLLEETLGTKFTVVAGYQGGGDIDLAVERGELQCRALTVQAFHSREPYHSWRKNNFVRIVMQTGRARDARLPEAPTLAELMDDHNTTAEARRLVPLVLASGDFGRPIIGPPGVAPEKIKIMRDAFMQTMNDPELLAEAKKKNLSITPTRGEELEMSAKKVVVQSPEMMQRLKTLMNE